MVRVLAAGGAARNARRGGRAHPRSRGAPPENLRVASSDDERGRGWWPEDWHTADAKSSTAPSSYAHDRSRVVPHRTSALWKKVTAFVLAARARKQGKQFFRIDLSGAVQSGLGLVPSGVVVPASGDSPFEEREYHIPFYDGNTVCIRQRAAGYIAVEDYDIAKSSGVDNTGNVCVWKCEELLAYELARTASRYAGRRVMELGAGMSALAALVLAQVSTAQAIVATDGNPQAVSIAEENIQRNASHAQAREVRGGTLLWNRNEDPSSEYGKFDTVVASDCLFFVDYHEDLVHTIDCLVAAGGEVLMYAARRGDSVERFLEVAASAGWLYHVQPAVHLDDERASRAVRSVRSRGARSGVREDTFELLRIVMWKSSEDLEFA